MADAPRRKPDPERDELRDLLRRRRQLVNQRVQELNRLDKGITKGSRASTKRHIAWLDDEIARVDEEYKKALQSSSELSRLPFTRVFRAWAYSPRLSWRRTCRS